MTRPRGSITPSVATLLARLPQEAPLQFYSKTSFVHPGSIPQRLCVADAAVFRFSCRQLERRTIRARPSLERNDFIYRIK